MTNRPWARENLHAWCVVPFDAKGRGPEERAQMLARLGFRRFAYDWRPEHVPTFDEEIEALKRHGIELLAWWFSFDPADALAERTLEVFERHDVQPQLWVMQSAPKLSVVLREAREVLPAGCAIPQPMVELDRLSQAERHALQEALARLDIEQVFSRLHSESLTTTPEAQEQRVEQEADRIQGLAQLARPYGCPIGLYNHNGWFGMVENEVAIVERLAKRGVTDVGIVYNFSHARDELHDDSTDFRALWARMQPYVIAVNVAGVVFEGTVVCPSQGDAELAMMRVIEGSGWHGPVGLIAEQGGDAEVTLWNCLTGLDWLAAELAEPGSGGPRPFPVVTR
jgi:sugar phosphate isomerase/epimerase